MSHVRRYLICYDIREPKRLRRVHRAMRDVGKPVQFSVFETELDAGQLQILLGKLGELIDAELDSVNFYPLTPECQKIQLGKAAVLDELILV